MITRRDIVIAGITALTVIAFAQTTEKPVMKPSLFRSEDFEAEPTKAGARRSVFDAHTATLDQMECHVTTLNPSEAPHAAHQHPEEELIIIREGTLEVVQNATTNRVGPGGIVFQASNEWHGL